MKAKEWLGQLLDMLARKLHTTSPGINNRNVGADWDKDMDMISDHIDRHGMYSLGQTDLIADLISEWLYHTGVVVPDMLRRPEDYTVNIAFRDMAAKFPFEDEEKILNAITRTIGRLGYNAEWKASSLGSIIVAIKNKKDLDIGGKT